MAFMHMDRNFDSKVGVDVFLVENAALECTYQYYNMKLTDIPNDGSHKDNIVTVGIKLRF
jgi:opacity protein-like surface antigen